MSITVSTIKKAWSQVNFETIGTPWSLYPRGAVSINRTDLPRLKEYIASLLNPGGGRREFFFYSQDSRVANDTLSEMAAMSDPVEQAVLWILARARYHTDHHGVVGDLADKVYKIRKVALPWSHNASHVYPGSIVRYHHKVRPTQLEMFNTIMEEAKEYFDRKVVGVEDEVLCHQISQAATAFSDQRSVCDVEGWENYPQLSDDDLQQMIKNLARPSVRTYQNLDAKAVYKALVELAGRRSAGS